MKKPKILGVWDKFCDLSTKVADFIFPPSYSYKHPTTFPLKDNLDPPFHNIPRVELPTLLPQETSVDMASKTTAKARIKALDNTRTILSTLGMFENTNEDEMMHTLRELRRVHAELKDNKTEQLVLAVFVNHIEEILKNTYISAEDLLREAREKAKSYSYQHNSSDILYLTTGMTAKGKSGKEYYCLSTSTWGSNSRVLFSCNKMGYTDSFYGEYENVTQLECAMQGLALSEFKGERVEKDGVTFGIIKLFPHRAAEIKGKKKTPKEVIEGSKTESTCKTNAPSGAKVELPPQNQIKGVPLDKVSSQPGGQQLQPVT